MSNQVVWQGRVQNVVWNGQVYDRTYRIVREPFAAVEMGGATCDQARHMLVEQEDVDAMGASTWMPTPAADRELVYREALVTLLPQHATARQQALGS